MMTWAWFVRKVQPDFLVDFGTAFGEDVGEMLFVSSNRLVLAGASPVTGLVVFLAFFTGIANGSKHVLGPQF